MILDGFVRSEVKLFGEAKLNVLAKFLDQCNNQFILGNGHRHVLVVVCEVGVIIIILAMPRLARGADSAVTGSSEFRDPKNGINRGLFLLAHVTYLGIIMRCN